jgi:glycosyltransferase 2 family protein
LDMLSGPRFRSVFRVLLLFAGIILGIVLLVLLLRSVKLDQLGSAFGNADYPLLLLAVPPFLVNFLLRVPRWGLLFGEDSPDFDTLFGAMNVGYAINFLLPARLGEIVRAYWIRDRTQLGMMRTLSTIALERVMDGVTLVVILVVVAPTVAFPGKLLGPALLVGAAFLTALCLMAVFAYASARERHPLARLLRKLETGRASGAAGLMHQLEAGLRALQNRRALALLLLYTIALWVSNSILLWLVLRAFHIEAPLTAGFLLTAVLNLGMAVPSTPGYIGVYDFLFVWMLKLYHVAKAPALAAALGMHAIAFVPFAAVGIVYLGRAGIQMTLQMIRASAGGSEKELPAP